MSKLNCPNCGAPISAFDNKCPYCDTSYFDLSSIDINNNKPFYLKIKVGNVILTQLVKALPNMNIEMSARNMDINLTFQAIEDPKQHSLYKMILTE